MGLRDGRSNQSAQQLAAADLAIENPCEVSFAFGAFQIKFGHTAPAARRLSSGPLGGASGLKERFNRRYGRLRVSLRASCALR